jgi:Zn-dependent membrane protease YugP
MIFHPLYLIMLAPAMLLGLWAQMRVKSTYHAALRQPASMSGASAARRLLDSAGLQRVDIEEVPGELSDHYDPRHKVLRLSQTIYHSRTMASVGIAAHEAGHAIQDAKNYAPLMIRNAAVPAANFGSGISWVLFFIGLMIAQMSRTGGPLGQTLMIAGIVGFGCVVFFQVINLPVEFDASARAKRQLVEYGIVHENEMGTVNKVLNAAALTYVAATLQAVLQMLYFIIRMVGTRRR